MSSRKCDITAWDIAYEYTIDEKYLESYVSMYQSKLRIFKGSAAENFKKFGDHYDNLWINLMFIYIWRYYNAGTVTVGIRAKV